MSSGDGWNHNSHYARLLLAAVPRPCERALDVGCGLGGFARQLAQHAGHVIAIDREPEAVERARELSHGVGNPSYVEADFMTCELGNDFDFVSFVASLHHLPFDAALTKAAGLLRPGGVLAVLGLDRARSFAHAAARSAIAYPVSGYYRLTRGFSEVGAPILDPVMTLEDIRHRAAELLPGAVVRRHVLWRYSLIWTKR
jgi:SAM-dependent methyltransferase